MKYPLQSVTWQMASVLCAVGLLVFSASTSQAFEVLGVGTDALLGNDLTDIGDDGDEAAYAPPDLAGFDAEFFSSDEPGFGGGEFAYNVFDNTVGGGNAKWCCGTAFPQIVGANLQGEFILTHFTITSGNDTDARRPRVWRVEGSNDGNAWDTIFEQNDPSAPLWTEHNQVIRFNSDEDYPLPTTAYNSYRMVTDETGATSGAFFQVNEIEFFGEIAFLRGDFNDDSVINVDDFNILAMNLGGHLDGPVNHDDGDFNLDRRVDLEDFRGFKGAFPGVVAAATGVPEPSSVVLAMVVVGALIGLLRRRG